MRDGETVHTAHAGKASANKPSSRAVAYRRADSSIHFGKCFVTRSRCDVEERGVAGIRPHIMELTSEIDQAVSFSHREHRAVRVPEVRQRRRWALREGTDRSYE